jgi:hypothetical protein
LPDKTQDGSIGDGFISISPLAPATKLFDCGIARTTGAARVAKAAMLANINFKTMQSPKIP